MKTTLAIILAFITVALGAVSFWQWKRVEEQNARVVALQNALAEKSQLLDEAEVARTRVEKQLAETRRLSDQLTSKLQAEQAAARVAKFAPPTKPAAEPEKAGAEKGGGGFGKFLTKLLDDPDIKKVVRDQQRMALDGTYAPLINRLGLSPEEAEKFKDILADSQGRAAEKASALFGNSASNRADAVASLVEDQKQTNEQIKALLGDARFARYEDYQQTLNERTQLTQLNQQLTASQAALTDQQAEQILSIMHEEKQREAAATGQPAVGSNQDPNAFQAALSEENSEKLLQAQQTLNDRVLDRAKAVLSAEQLDAFAKFQANQLKMQRLGFGMARSMFGPGKPTDPPVPTPAQR